MQITVMSRNKAHRFFQTITAEEKKSFACISITGYEDPSVSMWVYPKKTIFLTFDDVDKADEGVTGSLPMDKEQANLIASFVKLIPDTTTDLVVHCEAGMSRSAGVAAAIMKWMTNDDSSIFDVPAYRPNMLCYRMTLESLMDESTDPMTEELATKILMKFVGTKDNKDRYNRLFILNKEWDRTIYKPLRQVFAFKCHYAWKLNSWEKHVTETFGVIKNCEDHSYMVSPGMAECFNVKL